MQPLISIVMATYCGEKFLCEQVDSLLTQTYPNLEFIFVDDASSDETLDILRRYAANDSRICLMENEQNQGYQASFERGIRAAKGAFIALSDQDDVWLPTKIADLAAGIGNASLIYADSELVDEHGVKMGKKMSDIKRQIAYDSPLMYTFGAWAPGHSMLFTREVLSVALPFDPVVSHDYLLGFAATCVRGIAYHESPLVHYRQHASNTIGANLRKAPKNYRTKTEKRARIQARLDLIAARCPTPNENKILHDFAKHCRENSLRNRLKRFGIALKHRESMLAYKGKSTFGNFIYCFKLLFAIY